MEKKVAHKFDQVVSHQVRKHLNAPRIEFSLAAHCILDIISFGIDLVLRIFALFLKLIPRLNKSIAQQHCNGTSGLHLLVPVAPELSFDVNAEIIILDSKQNVFNNDVTQVLVMIPGNPGHPSFYIEYMNALHTATRYPSAIIGHTGHSPRTSTKYLFSHFQQAHHKVKALQKLRERYPSASFTLLGHSIGAWISMEALKHVDPDWIGQVINLFPTVHHIGRNIVICFQNILAEYIIIIIILYTCKGFKKKKKEWSDSTSQQFISH